VEGTGILAGGAHFKYQKTSREIIAKVQRVKAVTDGHRGPIKLLRCFSHPE
jgi:hypothetical protein